MTEPTPTHATLVAEVRQLIAEARQRAAVAVKAELMWLYWRVGRRIHREILGSQPAGHCEEIVSTLLRRLTAEYGSGYSPRMLHHVVRFADVFPDEQIVHTLYSQLSWSHMRLIAAVDDPLKPEDEIDA